MAEKEGQSVSQQDVQDVSTCTQQADAVGKSDAQVVSKWEAKAAGKWGANNVIEWQLLRVCMYLELNNHKLIWAELGIKPVIPAFQASALTISPLVCWRHW